MNEKRQQDRLILDKSFNVYCLEEPCRIADVSRKGMGITFFGGEDWPENITLEYSLHLDDVQKRYIQCQTVWESTMLFRKPITEITIRRRGLEFVDQSSWAIDELLRHLDSMSN